tara:strand:+ start:8594 stop:8806 length:213 start_codon:yes stop_codon:yes gene_type:complete
MTPFKPHHNHGKIIELYFGTKANAMTKLNVSRPTIDKICRAGDSFYKYAPKISKICDVSINDIFTSLNSF